jgi:uncharacterized protein involved in tolerance to divalent cations
MSFRSKYNYGENTHNLLSVILLQCTNTMPSISSTYRWKPQSGLTTSQTLGNVEIATIWQMLTQAAQALATKEHARMAQIHNTATPH